MISYSQQGGIDDQNNKILIDKARCAQQLSDKSKPDIGEEKQSSFPLEGKGEPKERGKIMKADLLNKSRNPLLPAALVAIQRARQVARQTHTAIVVARAGRIERIVLDEVRELSGRYGAGQGSSGKGEDA